MRHTCHDFECKFWHNHMCHDAGCEWQGDKLAIGIFVVCMIGWAAVIVPTIVQCIRLW